MFRSLLLVALVLFTTSSADAQRRGERDAFGRAGAFAVAFEAEWLAVRPFMGGVGGRYWLEDKTVLTGSFSLRASDEEFTIDRPDPSPGAESNDDGLRLGFGVGVERHFGRSQRISPFVAIGTEFAIDRRERIDRDDEGFENRSDLETQTLGGAVFLGGEYRFAPGLTLAAAHAFGVSYQWGESVNVLAAPDVEPMRSTQDISRLALGTSTTSLTLSVYF